MDICFVVTYCKRDAHLVDACKESLKVYDDRCVLTFCDEPLRLKVPPQAGRWTERWMEHALDLGDIIVKVDPDTRAMRKASFPITDIFGQFAQKDDYHPDSTGVLMGGAIGFQRDAVKKILDSGFLRDEKYNEPPYLVEERRYVPKETVILNDLIVHDIAQRLGLSEGAWEGLDLMMSWEPFRPFHKGATFIHPVY